MSIYGMTEKQRLVADIQAITDRCKAEHRGLTAQERATANTLLQQAEDAKAMEDQMAQLGARLASPISGVGGGGGSGLFGALQAAGFSRQERPAVQVPFSPGVFLGAASFDGDYGDAVRVDKPAPALGADARALFPLLVQEGVGSDVTAIASFRQKSRTLADPEDMIRDIDQADAKPETDTEAELANEPLHQVATVETGVPNIMLESPSFRGWINNDLALAYSAAIDAHVAAEITAASPDEAGQGDNLLESAVYAAEVVAAAGYAPSVLAAAPQDLIELRLLQQPGSAGGYVGTGMDAILEGLRRVAVPGLAEPMVLDPTALGVLYASPVRVATFEENNGTTNTSTVRIEANSLYLVQRVGAVALATAGS